MISPLERVLLGTAVGDSLGLPAEGLTPNRIHKRWRGIWCQRFVFGRGMVSDDTEHTVFVAQCLLDQPSSPEFFQRRLAWKLRWWLVCVPAGIGFATLRAILKLWVGFPVSRSGVFSAGNGPSMRSAIIGAYFAGDQARIRQYVRASTVLTHSDPKAEIAAQAVASTASWAVCGGVVSWASIKELRERWLGCGTGDTAWQKIIADLFAAFDRQFTVAEYAQEIGMEHGVTGYSYHTVPVALYAWLKHFGDFRGTLRAVLDCGGDTDTVGAIAGALAAINSDIEPPWLDHVRDFPISTNFLRQLASALEDSKAGNICKPPVFHWGFLPLRNFIFLGVVLGHGFRRLIPF
ncbi:ADP-ribosylglycohydrolase family protein [soil metagenome]